MHFVQLNQRSNTFEPIQVFTEGCSNVDFKESIKVKFSSNSQHTTHKISWFKADEITKISAMDPIEQLKEKKIPLNVVEPVEYQTEEADKLELALPTTMTTSAGKQFTQVNLNLRTIAVQWRSCMFWT